MTPFFETVFTNVSQNSPLALIALPGAEELSEKIDKYLVKWYSENSKNPAPQTFLTPVHCPRFTSGDGKAMIEDSVRGKDLYIICDVGNHGLKYKLFDSVQSMSPDDHYANLKRVISAAGGKPNRITVIMPMLYGGRQHRRTARESLDCAQMLQELQFMGVKDLITFDAHDPRVQNAVPLMGFDNYYPTYQVLKAIHKNYPEVEFDTNHFMVVSPDEGAMSRNIYYASVLGLDLGMFYKRRDYAKVENGRNPIVAHEYIGNPVMGMDVFVADDIIATGDSCLKLAQELKEKGAQRIFFAATFSLFTEGVDKFKEAYKDGLFDAVISTNLTYRMPELRACEWFVEADMSKYMALIISACNHNESVSRLLDPYAKVRELVHKMK